MTTFKYICNRQGASLLYQQQDQKLTFIRARCNNGELQVWGDHNKYFTSSKMILNTLAMIYNWDIQSLETLYNILLYTYTFCYILK